MQRTCVNSWCQMNFEVLPEDREMLQKFDCPEPVLCPDCRHQQRGMFRGWVYFHKRVSDLSGQPIISIIHPKRPYPVYAVSEWWADAWDAITYGRDIDFSRPFFPQFDELHNVVPKMANFIEGSENCDYCAYAGQAKNAYYGNRIHRSEDVYYSEAVTGYCSDVCDCLRCYRSSYLYECVQCFRCHRSSYLFRCSDLRDCHYCIDCRGCTDCLFCHNLRNKSCHIFNKPVSREEFQTAFQGTCNGSFSALQKNLKTFSDTYAEAIWPSTYQLNSENCTGDMLMNCADCYECFDCIQCENNRYCWDLSPSEKNISSMDVTQGGIGELLYNCSGLGSGNYYMRMCAICRNCSNLTYCTDSYASRNCFGCTGLKSKEYCILNKQYTNEEYGDLLSKITELMRRRGEWGQFFPARISPFSYNESMSMMYRPLERAEALRRGYRWEDELREEPEGRPQSEPLPDFIDDVPDDACGKILSCDATRKHYCIIPQELAFYRRMRIPLPRLHPEERMRRRRAMLNPYRLFNRACAKCAEPIRSSYPPNRPEIVYCESCYLQTVY